MKKVFELSLARKWKSLKLGLSKLLLIVSYVYAKGVKKKMLEGPFVKLFKLGKVR